MSNEKNLPIFQDSSLKVIDVNEQGQSYSIVDYFLSETIDCKSDYYDLLRAINATTQFDEIHIHINCYGGDLDAAIQIYHSLIRCPAHVKIMVEGSCMSAATVIMMAADEIEFSPWSSIMLHAYSGGDCGKYQEIQSSSKFHSEWFPRFTSELYEDFLSEKEIDQLLNGKDFWMNADEAISRFTKIFKKREKEMARARKESDRINKKIDDIYKSLDTED